MTSWPISTTVKPVFLRSVSSEKFRCGETVIISITPDERPDEKNRWLHLEKQFPSHLQASVAEKGVFSFVVSAVFVRTFTWQASDNKIPRALFFGRSYFKIALWTFNMEIWGEKANNSVERAINVVLPYGNFVKNIKYNDIWENPQQDFDKINYS